MQEVGLSGASALTLIKSALSPSQARRGAGRVGLTWAVALGLPLFSYLQNDAHLERLVVEGRRGGFQRS